VHYGAFARAFGVGFCVHVTSPRLSARSYTAIIIGWKGSRLHGYRAENAMKHRDADLLGRAPQTGPRRLLKTAIAKREAAPIDQAAVAVILRSHALAKAKHPALNRGVADTRGKRSLANGRALARRASEGL
jgi:hypothetical protein